MIKGAQTFISIALSLLIATVWATAAAAQTFLPQGPSPIFGPAHTVQSGDAPPNGTSVGAVQAIVTDPTDANKMYIGTVNGGVWQTLNGGATWTHLSDNQRSLSIASLTVDPTDSTIVIAGTGITSSTSLGGPKIGLLYSNNGGASWSVQNQGLPSTSIVGVAVRGGTILAAASEPFDQTTTSGGLFRSVNGGAFQAVTFGTGSSAAVTSLASDRNQSNFYAAVLSADASQNGIWSSINNSGQTWTLVKNLPPGQTARLAMGPNGSVVAAVYNCSTCSGSNQMVSLMLSQNGQPFVTLNVPIPNTSTPDTATTFPGDYANRLLPLAIDPANQNIIYLGGSDVNVNDNFSVAAVRIKVSDFATGTATVEPLTLDGTANGSTVHADARAFAFDANGRLIMTTDGGVYVRTNPQGPEGTGIWTGLNGSSLQLGEAYAIAFDAISKRMVMAAQDIGVSYQSEPNGRTFTPLTGGDGHNAAVNDKTLSGSSAIYTSAQNLGALTRWTVNASGKTVTQTVFDTSLGGKDINFDPSDFTDCSKGACQLPTPSKMVLNKISPTMMAFGTNYAYTTVDTNAASDKLVLTNLGTPFSTITPGVTNNEITALAYGTQDNLNALLVGSNNGQGSTRLNLSQTGAPNSLIPTAYAGGIPTSVVFDPRAYARFFAVDRENLWATTTTGAAFTNSWTSNLTALGIILPTSLEFISNNGVNALLVGGVNTLANGNSPVAVADSDTSGNLMNWRLFGSGLPNTFVYTMAYNPSVDVLAMSLLGRGAWLLYDTTAYFPTATMLRFGLADNNSTPDATFLTNGLYSSRDLKKEGRGTLTIDGVASYTGVTTVSGGTIVVNGSIASSTGLTVTNNAILSGGGIVPTTAVMGTVAPGRPTNTPTTLTVSSKYIQASGSTYQALINSAGQSDRINVNGTASIQGGALQVVAQPGGLYAPRTTYKLLSATGGVAGGFSSTSVSLNSPFLRSSFTSDAGNIFLDVIINGFRDVAETPLQQAVGAAIDSSVYSATGDYATVLGTLANLDSAQVPAILTSLSGMNYSGFSSYMVQSAQLFMNNFLAQASGVNRGSGKLALAEACDVACEKNGPAKWGVWGGAMGGLGTIGAAQPIGGVTYNLGGFAAGLDRRITDNTVAGIALGYAGGTQWVSGFSGQGYSDTVYMGLYGSYAEGPIYLDALAGYAYTANRLTRGIVIPGLPPRTATGQTGANQVYGQLEAGYRLRIGTADAYVTPFARLQALTGTQNAVTESGAQSLSLNVAAQTTELLRTVFGAQIGGAMDVGWSEKLAVQLRFGWGHEFTDTTRPVAASFVGAPAAPFTTYGIAPQRDSAIIGLAANTAIAEATSVYLRYEASISDQDSSHALTAGLRMTW